MKQRTRIRLAAGYWYVSPALAIVLAAFFARAGSWLWLLALALVASLLNSVASLALATWAHCSEDGSFILEGGDD